ncbi:hypothetical protein ASF82_12720 [Frigoribacterium sp. Leaf164]|nr:hypothetical protein ASF82_12720 [Frigoribacterium sp. Leaf164]
MRRASSAPADQGSSPRGGRGGRHGASVTWPSVLGVAHRASSCSAIVRARRSPGPRPVGWQPAAPERSSPIEALVVTILAVAAVVLIVLQVVYRRRVMRRREAQGQAAVGRGTYVLFAVTAAFFLFAVFVFPMLVR